MTVRIAAAVRSPFCLVDGALGGWHPVDLAAELLTTSAQRAALSADAIDEVWVGCAEPVGAQGANLARAALLTAGWPASMSGVVVERAATSGMAALHAAAATIEAGMIRTAVVLGVGMASTVPPGANALARTYGRPWGDGPSARADEAGLLPAPTAADRAAAAAGIDRAAQDAWTMGSHERRGLVVTPEIIAIGAKPGDRVAVQKGNPISVDERRTVPDEPGTMPASFDPEGSVTGFSFAPPADGVTALVLTAESSDDDPVVCATGRSGGDVNDPLGGIDAAVAQALSGAGIDIAAIDRWHLTEPTAAAALLAIDRLGLDAGVVNVAGGTLGVGDAGAAEELRLVADAAREPGLHAAASFGPDGAAVTIVRAP